MCSILTTSQKSIAIDKLEECFDRTIPRGPDMTRLIETPIGYMGFHRLAIMGLTEEGMQPFSLGQNMLVCNGEIYGFHRLKDNLIKKGYKFRSQSDCEIILPLYKELGTKVFQVLGSEFALCIYDADKNQIIASRDPIGIRPLFYGYDENGGPDDADGAGGPCRTRKPRHRACGL